MFGARLVDHKYFEKAFDIYRLESVPLSPYVQVYTRRAKYNTLTTQVVFLVVSDDQQWIKVGKHFFLYFLKLIHCC